MTSIENENNHKQCPTKLVDSCQQLYVENQEKVKMKYKTACYWHTVQYILRFWPKAYLVAVEGVTAQLLGPCKEPLLLLATTSLPQQRNYMFRMFGLWELAGFGFLCFLNNKIGLLDNIRPSCWLSKLSLNTRTTASLAQESSNYVYRLLVSLQLQKLLELMSIRTGMSWARMLLSWLQIEYTASSHPLEFEPLSWTYKFELGYLGIFCIQKCIWFQYLRQHLLPEVLHQNSVKTSEINMTYFINMKQATGLLLLLMYSQWTSTAKSTWGHK